MRLNNRFKTVTSKDCAKKDARTLAAAKKRIPKRVERINPKLEYYSLLFACQFAGKPPKKANQGK